MSGCLGLLDFFIFFEDSNRASSDIKVVKRGSQQSRAWRPGSFPGSLSCLIMPGPGWGALRSLGKHPRSIMKTQCRRRTRRWLHFHPVCLIVILLTHQHPFLYLTWTTSSNSPANTVPSPARRNGTKIWTSMEQTVSTGGPSSAVLLGLDIP